MAPTVFEQGGSLSCHTCWDTGPRFLRCRPSDLPNSVAFYNKDGIPRTYSNPDPHGTICCSEKRKNQLIFVLGQFDINFLFFNMRINHCKIKSRDKLGVSI